MRTPISRHVAHRSSRARRLALAALCCAAAAPSARAAADDINAQPSLSSGFGSAVAMGRRVVSSVVDSVVETEHAVVHAIKDDAASAWIAPTWSLSADGPIAGGRAIDYVARANAAAAASTAANSDASAPQAVADLSFGAKLRVMHGDADLHIPAVAWMADVQPGVGASFATSSSALRPSTHLSAEWSLPDDVSFGVMPGMAIDLDASGRRTANGTLSVTLGKAWTPQWRTFIDMARGPPRRGPARRHVDDAGRGRHLRREPGHAARLRADARPVRRRAAIPGRRRRLVEFLICICKRGNAAVMPAELVAPPRSPRRRCSSVAHRRAICRPIAPPVASIPRRTG